MEFQDNLSNDNICLISYLLTSAIKKLIQLMELLHKDTNNKAYLIF